MVAPIAETPGRAESSDGSCRKKRRARRSPSGPEAGKLAFISRTRSGRKPSATLFRATKLLMSRPAAASSTTENAISATTRSSRGRFDLAPLTVRPPPCLSASFKSMRDAYSTGTSPKNRLHKTQTPRVNASTCPSMVVSASRGTVAGASLTRAFKLPPATINPAAPANKASNRLSAISWRTMRPRPAPIAARIAISRVREVALVSNSVATLAQAMSSTRHTAPSSR